jgi:arginyl-tRNA synthetase
MSLKQNLIKILRDKGNNSICEDYCLLPLSFDEFNCEGCPFNSDNYEKLLAELKE